MKKNFIKSLRDYPIGNERKMLLNSNCIKTEESNNRFFERLSLDKRMDDYEYEKKYISFVKKMRIGVGTFVEFESELRKPKNTEKDKTLKPFKVFQSCANNTSPMIRRNAIKKNLIPVITPNKGLVENLNNLKNLQIFSTNEENITNTNNNNQNRELNTNESRSNIKSITSNEFYKLGMRESTKDINFNTTSQNNQNNNNNIGIRNSNKNLKSIERKSTNNLYNENLNKNTVVSNKSNKNLETFYKMKDSNKQLLEINFAAGNNNNSKNTQNNFFSNAGTSSRKFLNSRMMEKIKKGKKREGGSRTKLDFFITENSEWGKINKKNKDKSEKPSTKNLNNLDFVERDSNYFQKNIISRKSTFHEEKEIKSIKGRHSNFERSIIIASDTKENNLNHLNLQNNLLIKPEYNINNINNETLNSKNPSIKGKWFTRKSLINIRKSNMNIINPLKIDNNKAKNINERDDMSNLRKGYKKTSRNSLSNLYIKKERSASPFNIFNNSFCSKHKLKRINYFREEVPNESKLFEEFMNRTRQQKDILDNMKNEIFNRRGLFTPETKTSSTRKTSNFGLLSPKILEERKNNFNKISPMKKNRANINRSQSYNKFQTITNEEKESNNYLTTNSLTNNNENRDNRNLSDEKENKHKKLRKVFSAKEAYSKIYDRRGKFTKDITIITANNITTSRNIESAWGDPTLKIKRKFLMNDLNDDKKEDREGVKLPKDCKREKDFIKDDNEDKNRKIYSIEKNKANMINHINIVSKITDENYYKYGKNLERNYEEYSKNIDLPEHVFAVSRYKPKLNTRSIDTKTENIRKMFESILTVKSRILNMKLGKDGRPKNENKGNSESNIDINLKLKNEKEANGKNKFVQPRSNDKDKLENANVIEVNENENNNASVPSEPKKEI